MHAGRHTAAAKNSFTRDATTSAIAGLASAITATMGSFAQFVRSVSLQGLGLSVKNMALGLLINYPGDILSTIGPASALTTKVLVQIAKHSSWF